MLIWSTCGFEYSGFLAADVDKPHRTFPFAMIGVIALVVASYLLPIATAIAVAPDWTQLTEGSYPDLAEHIGIGMH